MEGRYTFICEQHPALAASPDRLVGQDTVLEVKCPYTIRDDFISPATLSYIKMVDGKLTLDKNHNYYYQVQGQLLCTQRAKAIFVVYTQKEIVRIDIDRDEKFLSLMTEKLMKFYNDYFKHAVLKTFLYKNFCDYEFK